MTEHFNPMLESSDDEAPEEVTFEDSKESALRNRKSALETARRENDLLKEKRRKRHELFQGQKQRRLLPTDVLEEIDIVKPRDLKRSKVQDEKEKSGEGSGEEEDETETTVKEGNKTNVKSLGVNYSALRVKDGPLINSQQKAAMDFIQGKLYGPRSGRTTMNELLSLKNKRGRDKCAAVQFVKKKKATEKNMK